VSSLVCSQSPAPSLATWLGPSPSTPASCNADLQAGTLSSLLTLSDQLPKLDSNFTSIVSKLLDTLRSLLDDPSKLAQHARVNDRSAEEYLITGNRGGWRWDAGRWGSGGKVGDVVAALTQVRHLLQSRRRE